MDSFLKFCNKETRQRLAAVTGNRCAGGRGHQVTAGQEGGAKDGKGDFLRVRIWDILCEMCADRKPDLFFMSVTSELNESSSRTSGITSSPVSCLDAQQAADLFIVSHFNLPPLVGFTRITSSADENRGLWGQKCQHVSALYTSACVSVKLMQDYTVFFFCFWHLWVTTFSQ